MSIKSRKSTAKPGRISFVMPYGKHEGTTFNKLPSDYLYWAARTMVGDPESGVLAVLAARTLASRRWEWEGVALLPSKVDLFLVELLARRTGQLRAQAHSLLQQAEEMSARGATPSFEVACEAAGYAEYPGEPDYLVRIEDGEPVETVIKADIAKQLVFAA